MIVVRSPDRKRRLKTNLTACTFVADLPPSVDREFIQPVTAAVTEDTLLLERVKLE